MLRTWMLSTLGLCLLVTLKAHGAPLKVMIDPGHGGTDQGAVRGKYVESKLVLNISKKLRSKLKRDSKFSVHLSRLKDETLSLQTRKSFVEKRNYDIFLSIHANASIDPRARGVEFYFQSPLEGEELSSYFANEEQKLHHQMVENGTDSQSNKPDVQSIIDDLHRQNRVWLSQEMSRILYRKWNIPYSRKSSRAVKQAPFFLLSRVNRPSVLIEIGYLSNPKEAKRLHSPAYQDKIVRQIYKALVEYKEIIDNSVY